MKKTSLLLALCFIILQVQAQDYKVTLSNLSTYSRFARIRDAGEVGNNLFVFLSNHKKNKVFILNIYDKLTLGLKSSHVIKDVSCKNADCIDQHFGYVKTLFLKNRVVMLFQTYETSGKNLQLYAQRVDQNGAFEGKLELIDQIDAKSRSNAGSFMVLPSEDSTKFVIVDNPPFEKYNGEKFGFKIYDNNLKNQFNFEASLPYNDKDLSVVDFSIGDDSKIHLLTSVTLERKQQVAGEAASYYSIFTVNPADKSVAEWKIDLPKRSVEDASLKIDNKNKKFICCGFYSDLKSREKEGDDVDGFFYLRVDMNTKKVEAQGTKEIDKEMVAQLIKKKKAKDQQGIAKSFVIKEIYTHKDGSTMLIAENRRDVVVTICSNNGGCSTSYHYYRDNIFVIDIAANGTVNSFIDIPKRQCTANDGGRFSSFLTFKKDDRIAFIYNDNPENLNANIKTIKDVKLMNYVARAAAVAAEINKNGSYSKVKLFDNTSKKIALLPEDGIEIGKGMYVVPAMVPPTGCSCFAMFSKAKLCIAKIEM
jgi:hypothetical protein